MKIDKIEYNGTVYTIVNSGHIMLLDGVLYDQLDESLPIIPRKIVGYYIRKKYNLSQKDYYDLVVNGCGGLKHVCPICGKEVSFRGLTKGFYDNTCSKSHAQALTAKLGTHHFIKEFGSMSNSAKIITSKRVKEGTHQFQDYRNRARNHRSVFVNKGNSDDVCYFYITKLKGRDGVLKIGITSDIEYRNTMNQISGLEYIEYEILATGNRIEIADLEMNIKIDLHDYSIEGLEYFNVSEYNLIKSYVVSKFND